MAPSSTRTPITTWTAVARVLGVSVDTLARRRTSCTGRRPWFADEDEVRAWWRALLEEGSPPDPPQGKTRRSKAASRRGALDVRALVRELKGG